MKISRHEMKDLFLLESSLVNICIIDTTANVHLINSEFRNEMLYQTCYGKFNRPNANHFS